MKFFGPHRPGRVLLRRNTLYKTVSQKMHNGDAFGRCHRRSYEVFPSACTKYRVRIQEACRIAQPTIG